MKTQNSHRLWIIATASGLLAGSALVPARAQAPAPPAPPAATPAVPPVATPAVEAGTVTSDSKGRFYVEIKGATLYDAITMVQQSAGSTDYKIDESAKYVPVEAVTFNNASWDTIIRRLATDNNFKIVPQKDGSKQIEPRFDFNAMGGEGGYGGGYGGGGYGSSAGGGYPGGNQRGNAGSSSAGGGYPGGNQRGNAGGSSMGGARGGLPASPFSGGNRRQPTQRLNEQTAPSLAGATGTASAEGKEYRVLQVRHVYVGGIASLFGDAGLVTSEQFLIPQSAMGGGMGGMGGGMGGMGGGMGGMGMGGMMGGMGGMMGGGMGGFGGGGMGGMMGGGMGGFGGGGMGGFGGGGMGGGGFGF